MDDFAVSSGAMSAVDLDRVSPTRRPEGKPAGTQRWTELLFLHWTYEPDAVRNLVPPELELDLWDGQAYVGLVPFRMGAVRSSWMPRTVGLDFLETNVRTYVHHKGRPGVYFFSLEASSALAVKVARVGWGLPYFHAEMEMKTDGDRVEYRSRRTEDPPASLAASYLRGERLGPSEPGTLQFFLLERYLLFSTRGGRVHEGQVHHVPYPAEAPRDVRVEESLLQAAGLPPHGAEPATAHWSRGVDVEVFGPYPV